MPLEFILCMLSPKPFIFVRGTITWRNVACRLDEDIAYEGVPPRGNYVPPLEKVVNDDQAPTNLPSKLGMTMSRK